MATDRRFNRFLAIAVFALGLSACEQQKVITAPVEPVPCIEITETKAFEFRRSTFDDLPGWSVADVEPALVAFRRQCEVWSARPEDSRLSTRVAYAGTVADWQVACSAAADQSASEDIRAFFEAQFVPLRVSDIEQSKLTGYYEPEIRASRDRTEAFDTAIPGVPSDLVTIDLGEFESSLQGRKIWAKIEDGSVRRYDARDEITNDQIDPIAFASAGDVYFLQIQGSGRLVFEDGSVVRAGFAAHNHHGYESLGRHLLRSGQIEPKDASMEGIKAWMASVSPAERDAALAVNPRFIFFAERPLGDANEGPDGSAGIPLTPLGSIAVDLEHHAHGIPVFIDSMAPSPETGEQVPFRSLLIAQDTGGAIKGPARGDVFFGWGDEAGAIAGSTNSDTGFWVLLPRTLADAVVGHAE